MKKLSKESMRDAMWYLGQFLSTMFGIVVFTKYGIEAGLAVGYALLVLVDIRFNNSNKRQFR